MRLVLMGDNALSIALVLLCWWLAHQNAAGSEPFGRSIAAGYSLLAMSALANMLFRNLDVLSFGLPLSLLFSKTILVTTLTLVAWRLSRIYGARPPQG